MKIYTGKVVAMTENKTAIVEIVRKVAHPMYKKLIVKSKRYHVDTAGFTPKVDEYVTITETRHVSKHKYFKIREVKKQ